MTRRARWLAYTAADADDLVGETFEIACKKAAALPEAPEQQLAWLISTLNFVAANHRNICVGSVIIDRLRWSVALGPNPSTRISSESGEILGTLKEKDRLLLMQTALDTGEPRHAQLTGRLREG